MKISITLFGLLFAASAYAGPSDSQLLKCSFRESMSISFGYSSIYTFTGSLKDAGGESAHFYELTDVSTVAVDDSGSTNFPGRHVGDTMADINNHPWGGTVLLDIASKATTGPTAFHILVFANSEQKETSVLQAYKINSLNGNGLSGSCEVLDARLLD